MRRRTVLPAWLGIGVGLLLVGIALLGCTAATGTPVQGTSAASAPAASASLQALPSSGPCAVQPSSGNSGASVPPAQVSVRVTISGVSPVTTKDVSIACGSTALFALQTVAASVDVVQYPFGAYVKGVNGLEENKDANGKYWQYYVNQKLGPVAMDKYYLYDDTALDVRYEVPAPDQWN